MDANQNIEKLRSELDELNEQAKEIREGGPSTDLVTTDKSPDAIRKEMAGVAAAANKMAERIQEKSDALESAMKAEVRAMEEKMRAEMERVSRELAPMEEMVEIMQEGIWTVNLYLGSDEKMVLIKDGDPAPADTPIHVRQLVLAMDQECAVAAEDGGITAMEADLFDAWLKQDPAHVDQVIPEEKGIVALVPKKWEHDEYGRHRASGDEAKTYFLIRNGGMLLRVYTNFEVGDRLIPSADEFTSYFKISKESVNETDQDYETLRPGSDEWHEAEEQADEAKRHFMRAALILQGLVDRTTVLRPLPPQGINFLSRQAHEAEHVRFILDAENLLTDGSGRPEFREWQRNLNEQLQVGMRIVGGFGSFKFADDTVVQEKDRGMTRVEHSRIKPSWGEFPPSGVPLAVTSETENGRSYRCAFQRQGKVYDPYWGDEHEAKRRASVEIRVTDKYILPFDLASLEDLEYYLQSRINREEYVDMFPVIKAAILAKKREQKEEAPFRVLLIDKMSEHSPRDEAESSVDELIQWQKTKSRKHGSILEDDEKSLKQIVNEYKRRLKSKIHKPDESLAARLAGEWPSTICVHRNSSGRYVVVGYEDPDDHLNPYVLEREYNRHGELRAENESRLIGIRYKKWEIVWKDKDLWEAYDFRATRSNALTSAEIDEAVEQIKAEYNLPKKNRKKRPEELIAIEYDPKPRETGFIIWATERDWQEEINLVKISKEWKRNRDGTFDLEGRYGRKANLHARSFPWTPESEMPKDLDKLQEYERREYEHPYRLLYVGEPDRILKDLIETAQVKKKEAEEEAALRSKAEDYASTIEDAWVARKEEEERKKFIKDYIDESLWPGHKKLIEDRLEFPYEMIGHERMGRTKDIPEFDPEKPLQSLCRAAILKGVELSGLTVAEAVKATGWDKRAHKDWWNKELTIPDDLLTLKFSKPESDSEVTDQDVEEILDED
jgi:hypothetical protein